jgi:hypothetical protein
MPVEIINSLRTRSIIRVTGTGATTITLANLSVGANEVVSNAAICHIITSTTSEGAWTIKRGGSSGEIIAVLYGSTDLPLSQYDIALANNSGSDIYVSNSGTDGTLILSVTKTATYTTPLQF